LIAPSEHPSEDEIGLALRSIDPWCNGKDARVNDWNGGAVDHVGRKSKL